MVNFINAREVLFGRLKAVFSEETFEGLYPGTQAPKVYRGFPVSEPPFYAAVDEIVDAAETSGAASMGHAELRFTLRVWLFARHTDLKTASDSLLSYADAVIKAVLADQRLNMAVDNSFPRIETAGTAADSSKRYIAAASIAIECTVFSQCPAEIMEAVDAANGN